MIRVHWVRGVHGVRRVHWVRSDLTIYPFNHLTISQLERSDYLCVHLRLNKGGGGDGLCALCSPCALGEKNRVYL